MDSQPLSYVGLKTVLQHMEANLRFKVTQHIPSIRIAEKAVPLKIDYLSFDNLCVMVNKTAYELEIYRKRPTNNLLAETQCKPEEEIFSYDLDKYGLSDHVAANALMPGDILPEQKRWIVQERSDDEEQEQIHRIEEKIQRIEEGLVQSHHVNFGDDYSAVKSIEKDVFNPESLREIKEALIAIEHRHLENDHEEIATFGDNQYLNNQENHNCLRFFKTHLNYYEETIESLRARLLPYHCKRDDIPYPHDAFIQLTIMKSGHVEQLQRIKYHMKLHKAMKHLNTVLFGERRHTVQVKQFNLNGDGTVLRVPIGLKLRFRELFLKGNIPEVFKGMRPIVEDSSYSLNVFEGDDTTDFTHPIVKTAKKLIISDLFSHESSLQVLLNLPNKIVFLKNDDGGFSIEDYISLIQNWIEKSRKIGTSYSFGIKKVDFAAEVLELIRARFKRTTIKNRCVTVPINNSTKLDVSYEQIQNLSGDDDDWLLKMEIKAVVNNQTVSSSTDMKKKDRYENNDTNRQDHEEDHHHRGSKNRRVEKGGQAPPKRARI